jgi:mono/diheme cytochrome c family protein
MLVVTASPLGAESILSFDTEDCLDCHYEATPAIVADWQESRHARVTVGQALKKPELERRVSIDQPPEGMAEFAVGCAECHMINPDQHADTFDHQGFDVHVVVSPKDCATCHPEEVDQYGDNKMAHARGNLADNKLYGDLMRTINGAYHYRDGQLTVDAPDRLTQNDSCFHCHGSKVEVKEIVYKETSMGEFGFPELTGWPNQGVGRVNPDGSLGSCAACHTRHQFSIKMARQPYTCSQCHKGPDVPAYKVYQVSKHGNIFYSHHDEWNLTAVPWTLGRDVTAPTCAVCHVSLVMDTEGRRLAKRTHQMNDRLAWRLLGLIYAHPQPKNPDTSIIENADGLPLPTTLDGQNASKYLIDQKTMAERNRTMQGVCQGCHSRTWVEGHWELYEHSIKTTNQSTKTATDIIQEAWKTNAAAGPPQHSPFDEALEKHWIEQWLFYANSTRLTSAMGGADYGVFDRGRWYMAKNLEEMADYLEFLQNRPEQK